jgi:hypothetical protein
MALDLALHAAHSSLSHYNFLRQMVSSRKGVQRLARFVFDVFTVFNAFEQCIPAGYEVGGGQAN